LLKLFFWVLKTKQKKALTTQNGKQFFFRKQ
jgi:hypothetical protein